VSNALKFSKGGTVLIAVTEVTSDGTLACRVSVTDQGPGIEAARLGSLFSAYVQGETHGQAGVGLGLSIARQAADLLSAKLWAESEVGKGSIFHVELHDVSQ